MSTHTPGPWVLTEQEHVFIIGPDEGYHGILVSRDQFEGYEERDGWKREKRTARPNAEADARLIAAAPDLLEALKGILSHSYSHYGYVKDETCGAGKEQADARAAILKASSCSSERT